MLAINQPTRWGMVVLLSCATLTSGCMNGRQYYFCDPKEMAYYTGAATQFEEPMVENCRLSEVQCAAPPLTIKDFDKYEFWDLPLCQAVQIALGNSKVIRRIGVVGATKGTSVAVPVIDSGGGTGSLLATPDSVKTVYDPAIQETTVNSITQGVEAALSEFDAQISASMFWQRRESPANLRQDLVVNSIFARDKSEEDLGTFQSEISKTAATGSRFFFRNNVDYSLSNDPTRDSTDQFTVDYEAGVTQPLLRGAGTLFNRIAGPNSSIGVYNGVAIARINQDITLADFECNVRNMVYDLEKAYWELSFAYRGLDAAKRGRDAALVYLNRIEALAKEGEEGGSAAVLAGARSDYFRFKAQVEWLLSDLMQTERALRYQLGIAASDCRVIRPCDEPTTAKICFDFCDIHCEALCRSCELRQQKWRIKQKELELIAARNYLLPQLDAVGLYRWLGAGDDLIQPDGRGFQEARRFEGTDAFTTLTGGDFQEWQLGLQFTKRLGNRRELAEVRNKQLQLCRERARLQDQELTVSHLLTDAVRQMEDWHFVMQTQFNSWVAARERSEALKTLLKSGEGRDKVTFLDFREAIGSEVNAETEYYRALTNYNKEIPNVHFRKGSLLEYNGVFLAEGPWPCKAYQDARQRARERADATPMDYSISRPTVFSSGAVCQQVHPSPCPPPGVHGPIPHVPMPYGPGPGVPYPGVLPGGVYPGEPEIIPTPGVQGGYGVPGEPTVPGEGSTTRQPTVSRFQSPDRAAADTNKSVASSAKGQVVKASAEVPPSDLPSKRSRLRFVPRDASRANSAKR